MDQEDIKNISAFIDKISANTELMQKPIPSQSQILPMNPDQQDLAIKIDSYLKKYGLTTNSYEDIENVMHTQKQDNPKNDKILAFITFLKNILVSGNKLLEKQGKGKYQYYKQIIGPKAEELSKQRGGKRRFRKTRKGKSKHVKASSKKSRKSGRKYA